jgi:hypothetical protein
MSKLLLQTPKINDRGLQIREEYPEPPRLLTTYTTESNDFFVILRRDLQKYNGEILTKDDIIKLLHI